METAAAQNLFENDLIRTTLESRIDYPRFNLSGSFTDAARRSPYSSVNGKINRQLKTLSFRSESEMLKPVARV
jgi:hypothetical protein